MAGGGVWGGNPPCQYQFPAIKPRPGGAIPPVYCHEAILGCFCLSRSPQYGVFICIWRGVNTNLRAGEILAGISRHCRGRRGHNFWALWDLWIFRQQRCDFADKMSSD